MAKRVLNKHEHEQEKEIEREEQAREEKEQVDLTNTVLAISVLMKNIKPIWKMAELDKTLQELSYSSIHNALRNHKKVFKSIQKGAGYYCLVDHEVTQEELDGLFGTKRLKWPSEETADEA